jgi:hypothetical protein
MTLEEHRIQLLQRIAECGGAPAARNLIGEAHLMLVCCDLQPRTLRQFWEELREALDALQEELPFVRDHDIRVLRGSVFAAARVAATGLVNELDETPRAATDR